jgi:uncharacterized protein
MTTDQQKKVVILLAGVTIIGMPVIAMIIDYFADSLDMGERLTSGIGIWYQLPIGIAAGFVFGLMAEWIVARPFLEDVNVKYAKMIGDLRLDTSEIYFVSICAGIGEEVLFRGAIQPLAIAGLGFWGGIIVTSLAFVALHGYLSLRDWRISVYGLFMTGIIVALGWATEIYGIWLAIAAHTVIDVYLLKQIKEEPKDPFFNGVEKDSAPENHEESVD